MHNWHFLLLAFLAVLQPIASFTERSVVDGREQCCVLDSVLRDSRLSYGHRSDKLSGDHRISRANIPQSRRYEVRREISAFYRPDAERRLIESRSERYNSRFSPERANRFIRADIRQETAGENTRERLTSRDDRERHVRDTHRVYSRELRQDVHERDVARVRYSRTTDVRQREQRMRESPRVQTVRGNNRFTRDVDTGREFRVPLEARRDMRQTRDTSEQNRVRAREKREVLQRARYDVARRERSDGRQDRRVAGGRTVERSQSQSRIQIDNNTRRTNGRYEREAIDQKRSRSVDVDREREVPHVNVREAQDTRQRTARREVIVRIDERRQQHDKGRNGILSTRRESMERTLAEQVNTEERRNFRNSIDRSLDRVVTLRDVKIVERSREKSATNEYRRAESRRMMGLESRVRDAVMERRDRHTEDHREFRDSRRDFRLNPTIDARERDVLFTRAEYRDAKNLKHNAQFRSNTGFLRSREIIASINADDTQAGQPSALNWQYVFYTLQGIYLCSILIQKQSDKKISGGSWSGVPRSLVKVD